MAEPGATRAALITVSTSRAGGGGAPDEAGPELARFAESVGAEVVAREVVPDDWDTIGGLLRELCDHNRCELILTTGGTGFAPSDITPEATREAIERPAPGLAEAMRAASREHTPHWMLSRATAGVRGGTLIINFPGNPKAIAEAGAAIRGSLPHALRLLAGESAGHD